MRLDLMDYINNGLLDLDKLKEVLQSKMEVHISLDLKKDSETAASATNVIGLLQAIGKYSPLVVSLDLSYNKLDTVKLVELSAILCAIPKSVKSVNLGRNLLSQFQLDELIDVFRALPKTLEMVSLKGDNLAKHGVDGLLRLMQAFPKSLSKIDLTDNGFAQLDDMLPLFEQIDLDRFMVDDGQCIVTKAYVEKMLSVIQSKANIGDGQFKNLARQGLSSAQAAREVIEWFEIVRPDEFIKFVRNENLHSLYIPIKILADKVNNYAILNGLSFAEVLNNFISSLPDTVIEVCFIAHADDSVQLHDILRSLDISKAKIRKLSLDLSNVINMQDKLNNLMGFSQYIPADIEEVGYANCALGHCSDEVITQCTQNLPASVTKLDLRRNFFCAKTESIVGILASVSRHINEVNLLENDIDVKKIDIDSCYAVLPDDCRLHLLDEQEDVLIMPSVTFASLPVGFFANPPSPSATSSSDATDECSLSETEPSSDEDFELDMPGVRH